MWIEVRYDFARVDPSEISQTGRLWDYASLLPAKRENAPTLGEGHTPLVRIEALNRELGLPNLFLKLEYVNPTFSFKDRFHAVAFAVGQRLGLRKAAIVTTGNHGVACSAYAARSGCDLLIITDARSAPEMMRLMAVFGARVTTPSEPGPVMTRARETIDRLVREEGYMPSTVLGTHAGPANPYGVEGYKTIAFETAAQLGRVPDRMCVPTSGGDALYGPFKGFWEMQRLGLCDRLPRMTACQPEGAPFIVRALREGLPSLPVVEPNTAALSIGDPTGSHCILKAIRESDGDAWAASDAEMLSAARLLARHGVFPELSSASAVAALINQTRARRLDRDELVVCVLTGSGMKWLGQKGVDIAPMPPLNAAP